MPEPDRWLLRAGASASAGRGPSGGNEGGAEPGGRNKSREDGEAMAAGARRLKGREGSGAERRRRPQEGSLALGTNGVPGAGTGTPGPVPTGAALGTSGSGASTRPPAASPGCGGQRPPVTALPQTGPGRNRSRAGEEGEGLAAGMRWHRGQSQARAGRRRGNRARFSPGAGAVGTGQGSCEQTGPGAVNPPGTEAPPSEGCERAVLPAGAPREDPR